MTQTLDAHMNKMKIKKKKCAVTWKQGGEGKVGEEEREGTGVGHGERWPKQCMYI
jgi:hypothetical protein